MFGPGEIAAVSTLGGGALTFLGLKLKDSKDIRDGLWKRIGEVEVLAAKVSAQYLAALEEKHKETSRADKAEWELGSKTRRVSYLAAELERVRAENKILREKIAEQEEKDEEKKDG